MRRITEVLCGMSLIVGIVGGYVSPGMADQSRTSEEIAERLAGAIRFETISHEDPANFSAEPFRQLADYLAKTYPLTHAVLELERVNQHTLLFRWQGSEKELAPGLFMSHTDVVPVEGAALEAWTHPPYSGVIADGHVWGRGAIDVKVGVILWLEAVEALLAEGFEPRRTIYLLFGHDEEIGGNAGSAVAAKLLEERGIRLAFLFDEGGFILEGFGLLPDRTTAFVVTAEKTVYVVELTARGVSGHSSMPPEHTAIGNLARAIRRVEDNPMPTRLIPPVREMLETASPYVSFGRQFMFGNLWMTGGLVTRSLLDQPSTAAMVRTTFAVTLVSGGVKHNVIPELAQATINVRILPGDTKADVLAHLAKVIDDPEIEIEGTDWGTSPAPAEMSGPAFTLAADAVMDVITDAIVLPGMVPGATDSRHFAGISDEILRFVPQRAHSDLLGGAHGRDERIKVEHLADSVAIAIGMVRRAAAPEPRAEPRADAQ